MTLSLGVFTFINAWWIALFFVLPFAGKTPRWKRLLLINSIISLGVTLLLALVMHSGIISFQN